MLRQPGAIANTLCNRQSIPAVMVDIRVFHGCRLALARRKPWLAGKWTREKQPTPVHAQSPSVPCRHILACFARIRCHDAGACRDAKGGWQEIAAYPGNSTQTAGLSRITTRTPIYPTYFTHLLTFSQPSASISHCTVDDPSHGIASAQRSLIEFCRAETS